MDVYIHHSQGHKFHSFALLFFGFFFSLTEERAESDDSDKLDESEEDEESESESESVDDDEEDEDVEEEDELELLEEEDESDLRFFFFTATIVFKYANCFPSSSSFSRLLSNDVRESRCTYFLFPVHSYVQ